MKDAHAKRDLSGIDRATEKLNNILQAVSQNMYQGGQQQQGNPNPNPNMNNQQSDNNQQNGNDTATDTDFEEVK